jgi:transposase
MRNGQRGRYTLEFKKEAVRLVESGLSIAAAARDLGVVEQTLFNWVKAHRAGTLKKVSGKAGAFPGFFRVSARVVLTKELTWVSRLGAWPTRARN